jgi:hypothetical protein
MPRAFSATLFFALLSLPNKLSTLKTVLRLKISQQTGHRQHFRSGLLYSKSRSQLQEHPDGTDAAMSLVSS